VPNPFSVRKNESFSDRPDIFLQFSGNAVSLLGIEDAIFLVYYTIFGMRFAIKMQHIIFLLF